MAPARKKQVMVIAAHQDDEVLGCGGTLAKHAADGDHVSAMWFTDGVGSRPSGLIKDGEAEEQRRTRRRRETYGAMRALGAGAMFNESYQNFIAGNGYCLQEKPHRVGYWARYFPDQKLDTVPLMQLADYVAIGLNEIKPDIVYTHWPYDLNQDHRAVAQAVLVCARAWTGRAPRLLAFEVPETTAQAYGAQPFIPNTFIDISKTIDRKSRALGFYASEKREPPHPRSDVMMRAHAAVRGSTVGCHYAEAFVLLREVCL